MTKPDCVTEEHLEYLDNLRESGVTNMFGAYPYLVNEFNIKRGHARQILLYWMKSFGKDEQ